MIYKEYKPAPPLEAYVKCYYTIAYDGGTILEDRAFATGCVEVMFTLDGARWQTDARGAYTETGSIELWGQILRPLAFRVTGHSEVFGIRFHPATAALLLREDINVFNDEVVDMAHVAGASITDLHGRLQEAKTVSDRTDLVNAYLLKKLAERPKVVGKIDLVRQVMTEMTQPHFLDHVDNVAARYGITSRYLQKVFVQYTGLTPKLYTQINRFQNSLILMGKGGQSLTSIAYACGYFDQSHFIREFRSFTGNPPSGFDTASTSAILASPNK